MFRAMHDTCAERRGYECCGLRTGAAHSIHAEGTAAASMPDNRRSHRRSETSSTQRHSKVSMRVRFSLQSKGEHSPRSWEGQLLRLLSAGWLDTAGPSVRHGKTKPAVGRLSFRIPCISLPEYRTHAWDAAPASSHTVSALPSLVAATRLPARAPARSLAGRRINAHERTWHLVARAASGSSNCKRGLNLPAPPHLTPQQRQFAAQTKTRRTILSEVRISSGRPQYGERALSRRCLRLLTWCMHTGRRVAGFPTV